MKARKIIREILFYIAVGILIVIGLIVITNLLIDSGFTPDWFSKLSSIATSFASITSVLLLLVTFFYLLATRNMVTEMKKQRELQEEPVVSVRIVPDEINFGMLNFLIKNTGGSPAYDVSISFDPDLPYHGGTVNEIRMFNNMPVLDKNESINFLFASSHEYFNSDKPKNSVARIQYYKAPITNLSEDNPPIIREIRVNIEERKGQLYVNRNGMHDLVKEIEELKQVLLISMAINKQKDEKDD
ncbi:hypothetical protein [Paenibacillus alkalitolerans]|uniref:hypothetical protein n=1 Tax=Paenibacillus alkalitolerans TaxID=2799335 RepID=UPI0018F42FE6|nr:hypothetical protein [Paenibacillus alkalitolerans]